MCAAAIALPLENKIIYSFSRGKGLEKKLLRALVGFACVGAVFGIFCPHSLRGARHRKMAQIFPARDGGSARCAALFKKLKI